MTLLQLLRGFDHKGHVLLSDKTARPLLRYGLIAPLPGVPSGYHLTYAGRSLLATMKGARA